MVMKSIIISLLVLVMAGCAGTESFNHAARAGDSISLAVGWRQNLNKSNITVEITPVSTGIPVVYGPDDPAIRAVFNLYPDPLSSIIVSPQVGEDLTPSAQQYAGLMEANFVGPDKDWSQTVVFVDLPVDLPVGRASIQVSGGGYVDPPAARVVIVDGVGSPTNFSTEAGGLNAYQLDSLGRVDNYVVSFSGSVIPHVIQVDFSHDPDRDNGGVGKAHVVNPRGDIKNIVWHGDGVSLHAILGPSHNQPMSDLAEFKFYVAGGLTGLSVTDVKAYDIDGNEVAGVSAGVTASP